MQQGQPQSTSVQESGMNNPQGDYGQTYQQRGQQQGQGYQQGVGEQNQYYMQGNQQPLGQSTLLSGQVGQRVPIAPVPNVNVYSTQPQQVVVHPATPLCAVNKIMEEVVEVQPVITRERQLQFHQPVIEQRKEVVVEPDVIDRQSLPQEQHFYQQVPGGNIQDQVLQELGRYTPVTTTTPVLRKVIQKPPVVNENVVSVIVEEVQPVIEREIHQKHIIQQTLPVYDVVYENPMLLPTVVVQGSAPLAAPARKPLTTSQRPQYGERYSYGGSAQFGGGQQPLPATYQQPIMWQQQPLYQPVAQPMYVQPLQQQPLYQPTAQGSQKKPTKMVGLQKLMPKKKRTY